MAPRKNNVIMFSLLALTAIIVSACTQPYSSVPLETPDVDPTSLFVEPVPTNAMEIIENFATGTAMAAQTEAALTSGPSQPGGTSGTEITPGSNAATNTPGGAAPTATSTLGSVAPSATQPAPTVITNSPGSYTLQNGEFPFCIARRFNVDPAELLAINGIADGNSAFSVGLSLKIPQSGNPFPGDRSLNNHPATFVVGSTSNADTVYGVACYYGDVDPAAIVRANSGISLSSTLTVGQQISIP